MYHYNDVIMGAIASQITEPHDCFLNRLFRRRSAKKTINDSRHWPLWGQVNSPHKWPITRKMFPFYDVIMIYIWVMTICITFMGFNHGFAHILTKLSSVWGADLRSETWKKSRKIIRKDRQCENRRSRWDCRYLGSLGSRVAADVLF